MEEMKTADNIFKKDAKKTLAKYRPNFQHENDEYEYDMIIMAMVVCMDRAYRRGQDNGYTRGWTDGVQAGKMEEREKTLDIVKAFTAAVNAKLTCREMIAHMAPFFKAAGYELERVESKEEQPAVKKRRTTMKTESMIVLVKMDDGNIYQALINKHYEEIILSLIVKLEGAIKITGQPIEGIEIAEVDKQFPKTK